jgi:hypothetical protein
MHGRAWGLTFPLRAHGLANEGQVAPTPQVSVPSEASGSDMSSHVY